MDKAHRLKSYAALIIAVGAVVLSIIVYSRSMCAEQRVYDRILGEVYAEMSPVYKDFETPQPVPPRTFRDLLKPGISVDTAGTPHGNAAANRRQSFTQSVAVLNAVKSHDVVFRGKILSVGKSPGFWSGIFVATQTVHYKVEDVYAGSLVSVGDEIDVAHVLVGGGAVEAKEPGLRADLFVPGRDAVVFAKKGGAMTKKDQLYVAGDDAFGILFSE